MPAVIPSEQLIESLAETVPQMVWCSDAGGKKTYCSRRYLSYTGAQGLEELDRCWASYVHPDDRPAVVSAWERSLRTGDPYECRYRMRRHDGVYREFLAQAKAVHGSRGEILRWIGANTDLHEQKQLEDARRRSEKLAIAGRLAANIAHEVNNPLASATNALFLASQDPTLSESTRSYLELVDHELRRIATVTRQTLRFHRQSHFPRLTDVGNLLHAVLETTLIPDTVNVRLQSPAECGRLFCYEDDIKQALACVIQNSLDAMPQGGNLLVRFRPVNAPQCNQPGIRISVADSGQGIPRHMLPDVCEPFVTKKDANGTGLGLYVTKGIVERHQGMLHIRSTEHGPRRGTTVALYLPYSGAGLSVGETEYASG